MSFLYSRFRLSLEILILTVKIGVYSCHCASIFLLKIKRLNFLAKMANGGDEEIRTPDPLLARQVLSQLSYTPTRISSCDQRLRV